MKKALIYAAVFIVVAGGLFVGLRGCTFMPWNKETSGAGTASVAITRDYGHVLMKTGQVKLKDGESAMEMVQQVAKVDTEYGGGFVSAIDGIASTTASGGKEDWFYYVNGVLSEVGSAQSAVKPGDMIWWDFHAWNGGDFVPAVVGAWPRPFTQGYSSKDRSTLLFGAGMEGLAHDVGVYLADSGAKVSFSSKVRSLKNGGTGPVLAFLTLEEAAGTPWVADLLKRPGKSGAFVSIEGGKLVTLDATGKPAPVDGVQAAVISTGTGMGDSSPVWLVLCDGEAGMAQARRLLINEPKGLSLKAAAAVDSNSRVYALPR